MSWCPQLPEWRPLYDHWPPWRNLVHVTVQMRDSQLVYIIHLATETCNCVWVMNKRSIFRDLLWHIYKSETSNEVWIADTPPGWPRIDRITDCSTRYGQAPAVCTRVRLATGRWTIQEGSFFWYASLSWESTILYCRYHILCGLRDCMKSVPALKE